MSEERIKKLEAEVAELKAFVATLKAAIGGGVVGGAGRVASDRELDDPQYGDEIVKKDPSRWRGESFAGRRMSECAPDYLDTLADFHDWCAERERADPEKKKYARYSEGRAAKARGWAARLRKGWKPRPSAVRDDPYADRGDAYEDEGF